MSEKHVMAVLNHPFLIRLFNTYKDRTKLYFLLEPSLGGELFTVLRNKVHFDQPTARFYAAGIVCAFEYMHSKGIIYRDLKPENLLLTGNGYIKITDFGFAKKIGNSSMARTWTLCGTPDYLAPEVVGGDGHGKAVDWWTLGVLIYEMLASYPPFYDEDNLKTYAKIMHGHIQFPVHFKKSSIDIVKKLLAPKPTKRLGVTKVGVKGIKAHEFYKGFNWDDFLAMKLPAPIMVNVENPFDLSNFEEYPEEDDMYADYEVDDDDDWDAEF